MDPTIVGRFDDELDNRASTELVLSATVPYVSGAIGEITTSLFQSTGDCDRGGVVFRITINDRASSFQPWAKIIPSGVELHLAGDAEAAALVKALKVVLSTL